VPLPGDLCETAAKENSAVGLKGDPQDSPVDRGLETCVESAIGIEPGEVSPDISRLR
jgi:hypothetical protein